MDFIQAEQTETSQLNLFQHQPLDLHAPSIRLIQILSKDAEGHIACRMRLASTDDEYTCLSYVWGEQNCGKFISVNNKTFHVRENLWNFLFQASALSDVQTRWLWIDAICIDQSNTAERQHQVQQMSEIYSGAKSVISWLGMDRDVAAFLREDPDLTHWQAFISSPYWDRAWITQEFVLAYRNELMARNILTPLDASENSKASLVGQVAEYPMPDVFATRDERWLRKGLFEKTHSLFRLLELHRDQECHVRRDRLFSLLGLSSDGANVAVNYAISDAELAWDVLKSLPKHFCPCTLSLVAESLGLLPPWHVPNSLDLGSSDRIDRTHSLGTHGGVIDSGAFGVSRLQVSSCPSSYIDQALSGLRPHGTGSFHGIIVSTDAGRHSDGVLIVIGLDLAKICSSYPGSLTMRIGDGRIQLFSGDDPAYADSHIECWNWLHNSITLELHRTGFVDCYLSMRFWFSVAKAFKECCTLSHDRKYPLLALANSSTRTKSSFAWYEARFRMPTDLAEFLSRRSRWG